MALKVSMKFDSKLSNEWLRQAVINADLAALEMATDVHRHAVINAPKDKGNLVASGRVEKQAKMGGYVVAFGGKANGVDVPYAKRRHYENLKNPQTLHYLERAGQNVDRNKQKYFRNK